MRDTNADPEKWSYPLVILRHPACVFSIPATPSWAFGSVTPVTPVSAAVSQPGPVTPPPLRRPTPEGRVSSAELEPHANV